MRFETTEIDGLWLISTERQHDDRGSFGRTFCSETFGARGLATTFVQTSSSRTREMGTVRGMHFQLPPHGEIKVVRCVRGAIHDVVFDLRPTSPTWLKHATFRLDQDNDCAIYIPTGCAHGFQTLTDDVEVTYAMSSAFVAAAAAGVRFDDPAFGVVWPMTVTSISDRDLEWPPYRRESFPGLAEPAKISSTLSENRR